MPPRKPPRQNRKPVKVVTTTTTKNRPAPVPRQPRHIGEHAVTTNQEPFAFWPDKWPPVAIPEAGGTTMLDEEPAHQMPALQTGAEMLNTAQFNDYDMPPMDMEDSDTGDDTGDDTDEDTDDAG